MKEKEKRSDEVGKNDERKVEEEREEYKKGDQMKGVIESGNGERGVGKDQHMEQYISGGGEEGNPGEGEKENERCFSYINI